MGMSDEEMMHLGNREIHLLQLRENAISTTRIHQQTGGISSQHKTGIINLGNRSVARSQHRNLIHIPVLF